MESKNSTTLDVVKETPGFGRMRTALMVGAGTVATGVALVPNASAATGDAPTVDYSKVTSGINDQLNLVIPIALGILGIVTGILIGVGFLRKMGVAKKPTG